MLNAFLKKDLKLHGSNDEAVRAWSLRRPHDLFLHAANVSHHSVASADDEVTRPYRHVDLTALDSPHEHRRPHIAPTRAAQFNWIQRTAPYPGSR